MIPPDTIHFSDAMIDKTDMQAYTVAIGGIVMRLTMTGMSYEHLQGCGSHAHDQWEIVVVLHGSGTLRVGDLDIEFVPGTIVCQPPNVPHSSIGTPDFQDMYLRIDGFVPPSPEKVPIFQDDEEKRFSTLSRMLYESFYKREANSAHLVEALLDALYQLLTGWSMGRIENPAVDALVRAMIFNIANPKFSIADHMRQSGYCTDHFRRCFKREMGQTPTAYMISLRIEHARRMLDLRNQGGYSIQQIAHMSGFADPYYFSTMFKKALGCSPTQYLRSHAREEKQG